MVDPVSSGIGKQRLITRTKGTSRFWPISVMQGNLCSLGEEEDRKLHQYIAVMMDIVVGNTQWSSSLACKRYRHSPEV